MAVLNGNNLGLYVNNFLIGCLTSNGFSSSNEDIDTTCKDNGGAYKTLPGSNKATMPFSGLFNPAGGYTFKDLGLGSQYYAQIIDNAIQAKGF